MAISKLFFWRPLWRWFKRLRTDRFITKLRKDLMDLNERMRGAGYTRNERRRIIRDIMTDIPASMETWLKED